MKLFFILTLYILISKIAVADSFISKFIEIRNDDITSTKVFETNKYYFSQVSLKWNKKSNRRELSRNGILQAINNFKNYFIKKNDFPISKELKYWLSSGFIKNKLVIKTSKKIEDKRFKNFYVVVFAFPKKDIIFNSKEINLNNLIAYNAKEHMNFQPSEREKFLRKLGFKDLELLWSINREKRRLNLNNVLGKVDPIQYQQKLNVLSKNKDFNITNLNILPSTKSIVINYLKTNKLDPLQKLTIESSICSHDEVFLKNLTKNNIIVVKENILDQKSNFANYIRLCNGFVSFSNDFVNIKKDNFKIIEQKFNSGNVDELNNITKLLEYYIQKNPLKFKAWNYLSAIMRYNKDFDRAHIISRVEIGIALTNKNKIQYVEALKSYVKSRIKINKELNNAQKQFIKSI